MNRKCLFILAVCFLNISVLFSQSQTGLEELTPVLTKELAAGESSGEIIIECNQPSCQIYLNSVYQGKSRLRITKLLPGRYILEIKKQGFTSKKFYVTSKSGYSLTYKILF